MTDKTLLANGNPKPDPLAAHRCRACLLSAEPERRRCARRRMRREGGTDAQIRRIQLSGKSER
ncbi:hypothetical protein [Poseidonocella sp. HB161398]|uniref:hypothetical protein n=1 Tax=Poseidonocella sp. HB161398 TaxID=2320855 RepID=UPI001108689D|nr:hypothetical protein [Poseidonocella sp. HB161398]